MKQRRQVNVLFTSVGRRVELLRAFRRAYEALGLRGSIVAADIDPLAPGLRVADRPYLVPRYGDQAYVPALADICRRERVHRVFPLTDPDVLLLATHRESIEAAGARVAVVSAEAAETAADKWKTLQFFRSLGLPVPRSWLPGDLAPDGIEFPLYIKPRMGSAGKGGYTIRDEHELRFFSRYVPDAIIQKHLQGPEVTSDVVCDVDGKLLAVVSRQRIEVRSGEVAKGVTVRDPAILDACVRIAGGMRATGPITVQCMWDGGAVYFTEVNARLGGGAPLAVAAGVDFPLWLLARAAELPVEVPPIGQYRTGVYLTRFDESWFVEEGDWQGYQAVG